ncbi:cbhB, partial [Symbiodinium pilosum]
MFKLKNREFVVDIDVSEIECAINAAAYFVEMDKTGNKGEGGNTAGALFGTGYCDAQCRPACCNELDVWEGNKQAQAVATHSCSKKGHFVCDNDEGCQGACDSPGCDFNGFRMGSKNFYGPGMTVDSNKTFTLVTQFITNNNKDDGDLQEIRRFFVQGGTVIPDTNSTYNNLSSISDDYCAQLHKWTGDKNHHEELGGLKTMGEAFDRGMVLALSLWDDASGGMQWLDGILGNEGEPGALRGHCGEDAIRNVDTLRDTYGTATITYSNIRFGPIGTTTTEKAGVNSTASLGTGDNADNAGLDSSAADGTGDSADHP